MRILLLHNSSQSATANLQCALRLGVNSFTDNFFHSRPIVPYLPEAEVRSVKNLMTGTQHLKVLTMKQSQRVATELYPEAAAKTNLGRHCDDSLMCFDDALGDSKSQAVTACLRFLARSARKERSKILPSTSGLMPSPVSLTISSTRRPIDGERL